MEEVLKEKEGKIKITDYKLQMEKLKSGKIRKLKFLNREGVSVFVFFSAKKSKETEKPKKSKHPRMLWHHTHQAEQTEKSEIAERTRGRIFHFFIF